MKTLKWVCAALAVWASCGLGWAQIEAFQPSNEEIVDRVLNLNIRNLSPLQLAQQRQELLRLMKTGDDLLNANPGKQGDLRNAVLNRLRVTNPAERARLMQVMDNFDRDYILVLLTRNVYRVTATGLRTDERQGTEEITTRIVRCVKITQHGDVLLGEIPDGGEQKWVPKGTCRRGELVSFEYRRDGPIAVIEVPQNYFDPLGPFALAKVKGTRDQRVSRVTSTSGGFFQSPIDHATGLQRILVAGVTMAAVTAEGKVNLGALAQSGTPLEVPIGTCRVGELITAIRAEGGMTEIVELPDDYFA